MDPKDQLSDLIRVQSGILVDCFKIAKDIEFLSTEGQPKEISRVFEGDPFFIRAGNYMWTILILELNKLYDEKEDYALSKTLNVLVNNWSKLLLKKPENLDAVAKLRQELNDSRIRGLASNIGHIRDKQSAHLDRNRLNKEVLIHIVEAKDLLDMAERIVSEASFTMSGSHLGLSFDALGLCEGTVKNLAAYNKLRE